MRYLIILSLFALVSCGKSRDIDAEVSKLFDNNISQINEYKNKCLKTHHELCCENLVLNIKTNIRAQMIVYDNQSYDTSYTEAVSRSLNNFSCSFEGKTKVVEKRSGSGIGVMDAVKFGVGAEIGRQLIK